MRGSQLEALPDWAPPQWLQEEVFFTQSSATEPGSQPVSQALDRGEVGESLQGDRFYLRKYQAISATMSSSRDRTSTVGRMWWLGTVTSSEEEGEAEPEFREHRQQRSRKRGQGWQYMCIYQSVQMLGWIYVFEPCVYCMNWLNKINTWHSITPPMFSSGHRPDLITGFSNILSVEISISSFCPVGMSNRK